MRRFLITATAFLGALVLLIGIPFLAAGTAGGACGGRVDPVVANGHAPVAGYKGDQLGNAAQIMSAASALGLDVRAQVIGVMTAMGESSLENITYGDWETSGVTNPDGTRTTSIGLFQQQDSWGTVEQRMNPLTSATLFFDRLVKVSGWESLTPSAAAHAVQINADPDHYTKWLPAAEEVVQALTGTALAQGTITCAGGSGSGSGSVSKGSPGQWGGYENGYIPLTALHPIPWAPQYSLRADAVTALLALNAQFRQENGYDLPINDGYRNFADQVQAKADYGSGAAEPGTSNHGWALAIDVGDQSHYVIGYTHPIYLWLKANAGKYGWTHPQWAEPGDPGGPDEAWHWEYTGI